MTESKNGLHVSDDLRQTPGTALSNPGHSTEPSSRATGLGTDRDPVSQLQKNCFQIKHKTN